MTNPYHDENGRFCSKQEMKAIVDQLGKAVANEQTGKGKTLSNGERAADTFDRWVSMKSDYEKAVNAADPDRLPTKAELKDIRHRVAEKRGGMLNVSGAHPRKIGGWDLRYDSASLLPLINGEKTTADGKFELVETIEIDSTEHESAHQLVLEGPDGKFYTVEYYQSKNTKYEDPFFAPKVFLSEVYPPVKEPAIEENFELKMTQAAQEFLATEFGENFTASTLEVDGVSGEGFWLTSGRDFWKSGWHSEGTTFYFDKNAQIKIPDPWDE